MKFLLLLVFILPLFFGIKPVFASQDCLTAGFWVEDGFYNYFKSKGVGFESWADRQMEAWSNILASSGVKDCFRIGKIVRVADGALPLHGVIPTNHPDWFDRSVDVQWGFPAEELQREGGLQHWDKAMTGVDWSLLHELSHARYLIDEYGANIEGKRDKIEVTTPNGVPVVGTFFKPIAWDTLYFNKSRDLMGGGSNSYAPHSASALNLIAGQHNAVTFGNFNAPANIGVYQNDLPKENILKILDNGGRPLVGAKLRIFQATRHTGEIYSKEIDNNADIAGATDSQGKFPVGHNPFGGNGIESMMTNSVFLLEVSYGEQLFYKFIEVSDFNLAYWSGATNQAIYNIPTNITAGNQNPVISTPTPVPSLISSPASTPTSSQTPSPTVAFTVSPSEVEFGGVLELEGAAVGNNPKAVLFKTTGEEASEYHFLYEVLEWANNKAKIRLRTSDLLRTNSMEFKVFFLGQGGKSDVESENTVVIKKSSIAKPSPLGTPTPATSCPASDDNCVYSQGDKCYSGHTADTSTCTNVNGTCLNPSAGCSYSCGPVPCPSPGKTPIPTSSPKSTPMSTPTLIPIPSISTQVCTPGEFKRDCTGKCGGCAADAGEARIFQCRVDGSGFDEKQSECRTECVGACVVTSPSTTTSVSPGSPLPSAAVELPNKVLVSNYPDFRATNAAGDAGSITVTINNPSGQTITWKLSTLGPSSTSRVFVRTITGDEYKDYEPLEMRDSETVSVAGINIQAKMVKRVVKMTISVNGQDQEIDLNNSQEIITRLPGNAGQAQRFSLPFVVEYSNGEVIRSAIGINYQPVGSPAPSSLSTPTPFPSASEIPMSTPTPSACTEIEQYNECTACNTSRRISKDSCGNYTPIVESQYDVGCASWCSSSPSPETRKEIVRITVNEQEIDLAELYSGFRLDLPGVTGQPQTFSIPVVVYYSDGSSRPLAYTFRYQPPPTQESCLFEPKYPECDSKGPGWVHEVWQNCEGKYDFRNIQFQAGTCGDSGQQPSPQEDSCPEDRSDQYPQCGGTVGLEDKDPTHTYLIIRVKDCQGNILRYEQEDLGDQGQCQN